MMTKIVIMSLLTADIFMDAGEKAEATAIEEARMIAVVFIVENINIMTRQCSIKLLFLVWQQQGQASSLFRRAVKITR